MIFIIILIDFSSESAIDYSVNALHQPGINNYINKYHQF